MSYKFIASINKEDDWFVAKDLVSGVASQGRTIQEAKNNLKEAVELYFEDETDQIKEIQKNYSEPIFTFLEVDYVQKTPVISQRNYQTAINGLNL